MAVLGEADVGRALEIVKLPDNRGTHMETIVGAGQVKPVDGLAALRSWARWVPERS